VANPALAELFSQRAVRMCLLVNTFDFLTQLGRYLENVNTTRASSIDTGRLTLAAPMSR